MSPSDGIVPESGAPLDAVQLQASDWFLRCQLGLTVEQELEFNRWLEADFRHARLYRENEHTWKLLRQISAETNVAPAARQIRKPKWMPLALAAAAVVAATAVFWHAQAGGRPAFAQIMATDIGLLRRVELPDGSIVRMNADSVIEVKFDRAERRIILQRGEAKFEVAKNQAWPFIVKAGTVELRAVGTAFDVRLRSDAVDLVVTEGRVGLMDMAPPLPRHHLRPSEGRVEIRAGQHLRIVLHDEGHAQPLPVENLGAEAMRDALAWEQRFLVFHADRLADIVSEFNRFNRRKLGIGSPELADRRFGGTFPANDYEGFIKLLEKDNDISDVRSPAGIELKVVRRGPSRERQKLVSESGGGVPRQLVFNGDRLIDIVTTFNQYNKHQLVIDDPELGALRFGGAFPSDDYKTFIWALQSSFGVPVESTDGETHLGSRRRAERPKTKP